MANGGRSIRSDWEQDSFWALLMGRGSKRLTQSFNRRRNGLAEELYLPSWAEAVYQKEQAESF